MVLFFVEIRSFTDEMLETIGQGTFGKVVKCFDLVARQMVAVKVVRAIPKYSESADYEIDVLTKIQARDPMGSKYDFFFHLLSFCFPLVYFALFLQKMYRSFELFSRSRACLYCLPTFWSKPL